MEDIKLGYVLAIAMRTIIEFTDFSKLSDVFLLIGRLTNSFVKGTAFCELDP